MSSFSCRHGRRAGVWVLEGLGVRWGWEGSAVHVWGVSSRHLTDWAWVFLRAVQVEGGRIDHALHANELQRATVENIGFEAAVKVALEMLDLESSLVVATADHSHGLTFSGYCGRGSPVTGLCYDIDTSGAPWEGGTSLRPPAVLLALFHRNLSLAACASCMRILHAHPAYTSCTCILHAHPAYTSCSLVSLAATFHEERAFLTSQESGTQAPP